MEKIYIAGCGGMLGEAFYRQFKSSYTLRCTDIDVNEEWLGYLDFRDFKKYSEDVEKFNPDYLFHLGAYTDLEFCEQNAAATYLTNTISVENAVFIANKLNIPILYISTAGIFDGNKDCYDDWDMPNPLGIYARAKYQGELFVKENASQYLICRAGWMMGGGPKKDKKFVNKIITQIKNGKSELFVVNDKLGVPTYTHDFAAGVRGLLENRLWGLYNMVCDGLTDRLTVAKEIVSILNLNNKIKITEVTSDYFKDTYFAPRPDSERLINRKLDLRRMNTMRNWRVVLKEYLEEYYKDFINTENN